MLDTDRVPGMLFLDTLSGIMFLHLGCTNFFFPYFALQLHTATRVKLCVSGVPLTVQSFKISQLKWGTHLFRFKYTYHGQNFCQKEIKIFKK